MAWPGRTKDVTQVFLAAGQIPGLISRVGGPPEPVTWPVTELADLADRANAEHPDHTFGFSPIEGLPILHELFAARSSRGDLRQTRDNVLITTGGMHALELLGKVLLEDGGLIAAQTSTYPGAPDTWRPRHPAFRLLRFDDPALCPVALLTGAQFA